MTGCPSRYLATLATRPSWPTATTTSSGAEQEPGQVGPVDVAAAPVGRDGRADGGQRRLLGRVPGRDLVEVAGPRWRRKYSAAAAGAVPGEQLVELAAPRHHHHPGRQCALTGPAVPLGPVSRPSRSASTSGVTVSWPISGSCRRAPAAPGPAAPPAAGPGTRPGAPPPPRPRRARRRVPLGAGLGAAPARRRPRRRRCSRSFSASAARRPRTVRRRRSPRPAPARPGLGRDQRRGGVELGLAAGVRAVLLDQLLLPAGQLDLALQLVLGDARAPARRRCARRA